MPSPVYQYVVSLVVTLPIMGCAGVLMNDYAGEHIALYSYFLWQGLLF